MSLMSVDISQDKVKVYILDQDGDEPTKRFELDNNPSGSETITDQICECFQRLSINKSFMSLEYTSVYGWHLQFYLADHRDLKSFDPMIIIFNTKIIDA